MDEADILIALDNPQDRVGDDVQRLVNQIAPEYKGIHDYDIEKEKDIHAWKDKKGVCRHIVEIRITLYTNKEDI